MTLILQRLVFSMLFCTLSLQVAADLSTPTSWVKAKKVARDEVYFDQQQTFYCGCTYQKRGRSGGAIILDSCGYDAADQSYSYRANRLEWEHVVPASLTPAKKMSCWTTGLSACDEAGRECCEQHDKVARSILFDLHNLVPSIGQVNALRSDSRYAEIEGERRLLGICDFEWNSDIAEPAPQIEGDIARIWLYMHTWHGVELLPGEVTMYRRWSCDDPPSKWEVIRNERIGRIQGNKNQFVARYCGP